MMEPILEVHNLKKYFKLQNGVLKAVNGVDFVVYKGETLGVVGESGCGKTTCGRTCIGMYEKTAGIVTYKGREVQEYRKKERVKFTREVQCIFQDPYSSLDPRMRVSNLLAEGIDTHHLAESKGDREDKVKELLLKEGLSPEHMERYPHEFSGGQRQRIGIARALSVEPEFIFCDEPVSALDISVQAQVMNLLMDLQETKKLTYLFVSHDISMVQHISDRIAVFYMGKIVELAQAEELSRHPQHPYTKALLSAVPTADPDKERYRKRILLSGDVPSPLHPPDGCGFQGRCPYAKRECAAYDGTLKEISPGHYVACRLLGV